MSEIPDLAQRVRQKQEEERRRQEAHNHSAMAGARTAKTLRILADAAEAGELVSMFGVALMLTNEGTLANHSVLHDSPQHRPILLGEIHILASSLAQGIFEDRVRHAQAMQKAQES